MMRKEAIPNLSLSLLLFMALLFGGCAVKRVPAAKEYQISSTTSGIEEFQNDTSRFDTLKLRFSHSSKTVTTSNIYYIDEQYRKQPYSYSRWYDTVETMFEEKLIKALKRSKTVKSVLSGSTAARSDYILELDILEFVQEFPTEGRSFGKVVVMASLVRSVDRKVISSKLFESTSPAPQDSAEGGVEALNRATDSVVTEILEWLNSKKSEFGKSNAL